MGLAKVGFYYSGEIEPLIDNRIIDLTIVLL